MTLKGHKMANKDLLRNLPFPRKSLKIPPTHLNVQPLIKGTPIKDSNAPRNSTASLWSSLLINLPLLE